MLASEAGKTVAVALAILAGAWAALRLRALPAGRYPEVRKARIRLAAVIVGGVMVAFPFLMEQAGLRRFGLMGGTLCAVVVVVLLLISERTP